MIRMHTLTERLKTSWLRPLLVALFVCVAGVASAADSLSVGSITGCCYPGGYSNQNYSVYGVAVPGCNAPPVYGACGSGLWGCSSGTAANGSTSASAYTWQCLGSNGGTNASCSQSILGTWSVGGWSSCSVTACGSTGTQAITYSCSDGNCDPSTKPANGSQSCSTAACAPTYTGSWIASTGSCSVTACGSTGTQTTTYSCSDGNCNPATQPAASSQTCSTAACPPVAKTCTWKSSVAYYETYCTSTTTVSTYGLYAGASCSEGEAGEVIYSIGDPVDCPGYRINVRRVTDSGALRCSCN